MEDWRLKGNEEFLLNATLYQVKFPEFWEKAYREKNSFYRLIEKDANNFVEKMHRGEEYLEGEKIRRFWHEHCCFCWEKAMTDLNCEFYCTKDMKYWVCRECFHDFKDRFTWNAKSGEEL